MVNIHIYLESEKDAKKVVESLMEAGLMAHASIDKDNHSFMKTDQGIVEHTNYVITGQTKALLFDQVLKSLEKSGHGSMKVFSTPITQCNEAFSEIIRENTNQI
ncbi:MAG: divalent cation tolerance protein CutA [Bacteroidia bacterium]|nr:divalent cation tolerance protein CutA [Bacteroidia bacterium]